MAPRQIVDPPVFSPSPFGLTTVVQMPVPSDEHWKNGVTWQSQCLSPMGRATYDECLALGTLPEPSVKTNNLQLVTRGATPFTAYAKFDCSTVSNGEAQQAARDALARSELWQVERAFWTGVVDGQVAVYPHLAASAQVLDPNGYVMQSAASVVATGTALNPTAALGLLESGLADCYNGRGVLHVPVKVLPVLVSDNLVHVVGDHLETWRGNLVAVGAGYPGTSPTGAVPAPTQSWIYATGAVFGYSSEVYIPDVRSSIVRSNNNVEMIAERTYVLGWDCCHAAVLVDIDVPTV